MTLLLASTYLRNHRVDCGCTVKGVNSRVHANGLVLLPDRDPEIREDGRFYEDQQAPKVARRRAARVANGEPDEDENSGNSDADSSSAS